MTPFILPPGYTMDPNPPMIDLDRYNTVLAAGRGPISGNPANSVAQLCSAYFGADIYAEIPLNEFTRPAYGHSRYGY